MCEQGLGDEPDMPGCIASHKQVLTEILNNCHPAESCTSEDEAIQHFNINM